MLHRGFEAKAKEFPERVALRVGSSSLMYGELDVAADAVASNLRALDLEPASIIAVSIAASFPQIAAVLGVLKAGLAYLPATPDLPLERLRRYCEQARARAILQDATSDSAEINRLGLPVLPVSINPGTMPAPVMVPRTSQSSSPDDLAYVIFTSGSTGSPKGVMITHGAALNTITDIIERTAMDHTSCVLGLSSLNFDLSVFDIFGTLAAGGTLVLVPPSHTRDPQAWLQAIKTAGVTVWNSVPPLMALLVEASKSPATDLASLQSILLSGDWIPLPLVERLRSALPNARILSLGGATEASIWSICYEIATVKKEWRSVPYGRALTKQTCTVLADECRVADVGEVGHIFIGGLGVARGYISNPELTAASFRTPPPALAELGPVLYKTGDLGRYMDDGNIEFLGREDQQVKINGNRVELTEIKHVLESHAQVAAAAVGITDSSAGDRIIVAHFQAREGAQAGLEHSLREWLAERLPNYMVPTFCLQVDRLKLTENGKADVKSLPGPVERPRASSQPHRPKNGLTILKICQAWSEFMDGVLVAPEDDFFLLGGYSLLAFRISNYLRDQWGINASPTDIMRHRTPAAIAQAVAAGAGADHAAEVLPRSIGADVPRNEAYRYAVSKQQEQVWLLSQINPENIAYQFQAELTFSGKVVRQALVEAMRILTQRHEGLRTWFDFSGPRPEAVVEPQLLPHIDSKSLADLSAAEAEIALRREVDEFVRRPVPVDRPPLVHWRFYDLPDGRTTLVHLEHHLVHDGWTFRLFLRELANTYRSLVLEEDPETAAAPTYSYYAQWQQQWLCSADADRARGWWRAALKDVPPYLALPFRWADGNFMMRGDIYEAACNRTTFFDCQRAARTSGCSVFQLMFAAYCVLLFRLTSRLNFVVGTSTANRGALNREDVIGMYVNMMPIPVACDGALPFATFLQKIAGVLGEALAAAELPFVEIIEAINPPRIPGSLPLMQVCFNFHDAFSDDIELPDAGVSVVEAVPNGSAKFELNLTVIPLHGTAGGARLLFEYSTDHYRRDDIAAFAALYQTTLEWFTRRPTDAISAVPLLQDGPFAHVGRAAGATHAREGRIVPKDIENLLNQCVGVSASIVLYEQSAATDLGGRLTAYVVPRVAEDPPDTSHIKRYLHTQLPGHMVPAQIKVIPFAPLTSAGSIDWQRLASIAQEAAGSRPGEDQAAVVTMLTAAESTILTIFRDVLGVKDVDVADSFFERGGHSLLATRVCSRISEEMGCKLALRDMVQRQSARELAAFVYDSLGERSRGGLQPSALQ